MRQSLIDTYLYGAICIAPVRFRTRFGKRNPWVYHIRMCFEIKLIWTPLNITQVRSRMEIWFQPLKSFCHLLGFDAWRDGTNFFCYCYCYISTSVFNQIQAWSPILRHDRQRVLTAGPALDIWTGPAHLFPCLTWSDFKLWSLTSTLPSPLPKLKQSRCHSICCHSTCCHSTCHRNRQLEMHKGGAAMFCVNGIKGAFGRQTRGVSAFLGGSFHEAFLLLLFKNWALHDVKAISNCNQS